MLKPFGKTQAVAISIANTMTIQATRFVLTVLKKRVAQHAAIRSHATQRTTMLT